jgi:hypothetical protein
MRSLPRAQRAFSAPLIWASKMRQRLLAVILAGTIFGLLAAPVVAFSQWGFVLPKPVAAASYTGPGDVFSGATQWVGLRSYNAAYATGSNKAIKLRRYSDNTTQDINILASGDLDDASALAFGLHSTCTATAATTTLSISSCSVGSGSIAQFDFVIGTGFPVGVSISSVGTCNAPPGTCTLSATSTVSSPVTVNIYSPLYPVTWYDQTGNGNDLTQATNGNQFQFWLNCLGSFPCVVVDGAFNSSATMSGGSFSNIAIPYSIEAVEGNRTSSTNNTILGKGGATLSFFGANTVYVASGGAGINGTETDAAYHVFQGVITSNSVGNMNVDNTANSGSPGGTTAFGSPDIIGSGSGGSQYYLFETGVWPSAPDSTHQTSQCHNGYTYWFAPNSVGTSC